ncbi:MAG: DUF3329 domain-containing protein [Gammaproteobacteria bacterium]|nr:DUF3329 domain-containing protein [Gammaproteobacteria bacterium]
MNKIWETEKAAIFFTVVWISLIGIIFQNWIVAILFPLVSYIIWLYFRLYQLEKWLSRGTKASQVFNDNGFIGLIIRHLYIQKKVNNNRKKRTKEILRRLNTNISALPDATVLLDQNYEIEWANPPATYLLGINRRDIGQRIDNLIRNPKFQSYLINPDNKPKLEIQSPLDKKIILQIKAVSFGKNQRLLIFRNISDQKQLQEALKNFVANTSHELQTPLTSIMGYLEMLETEQGLTKVGKKSVTVLQQQSQRMKQLIQDLLMLSRVESYQLEAQEGEQVSLTDSMQNVMRAIGKSSNKNAIQFHTPDGFYLLGVQSEIESICINLIENAIKHSPKDTSVSISWEISNQGEYIFSVTDKGMGIKEQDLPYITDRYYRGSDTTSKQISGSGLGLAIVQQIAQKHGAKVSIKSKLNKGSTFSVTFPDYRSIHHQPKTGNVYSL